MSANQTNTASCSSNEAATGEDGEIERTLFRNLREVLKDMREYYGKAPRRALKRNLEELERLATERVDELDVWQEPEKGDTRNVAIYAATTGFVSSLQGIIGQMWMVYRANGKSVPASLIQDLEDLIDAREAAELKE